MQLQKPKSQEKVNAHTKRAEHRKMYTPKLQCRTHSSTYEQREKGKRGKQCDAHMFICTKRTLNLFVSALQKFVRVYIVKSQCQSELQITFLLSVCPSFSLSLSFSCPSCSNIFGAGCCNSAFELCLRHIWLYCKCMFTVFNRFVCCI